MEEIQAITDKYDAAYVSEGLHSLESLNNFAQSFYADAAEILDCLTRIRHVDRNPTGFSIDEAPILGLLVRVWKLLKEVIKYYKDNNAQIISIFERAIIEASITATYLLRNGPSVVEDYRKCSYKDRLRILRDMRGGSAFFDTKAGKRLLTSVEEKMAFEGLTEESFFEQKKNRWRIQGKSFRDIFEAVADADLYACSYGMMSESVHGSWNESADWDLSQNSDGTFSTNPFYHPADIRYVAPIIRFALEPYRLWLRKIQAIDDNLEALLAWIESVNNAIFRKFDDLFG